MSRLNIRLKEVSAKRKGKRERKKERGNAQVECLSIGETTQVSFRVETFDSVANGEQKDVKKLFSLSFSFFSFLSHPAPANYRHSRPPVLFCDVVESIYRGFSCLQARPARPSVLFPSSAIRAQVRGPYRPRLPNCGKPPTRLRERRFDKDRTERAGENNWSAFVWIADYSS